MVRPPADAGGIVVHVGNFSTGQHRELWVVVTLPPRLVSRVVDFQGSRQFFNDAFHPPQLGIASLVKLSIDLGLDAKRLRAPDFKLERLIIELKVCAFQFKLARLNDAVKFKISVAPNGQQAFVRNDVDILSFTELEATDASKQQPSIPQAHRGICH